MQSPDTLSDLFRANGRKITAQRQCIFAPWRATSPTRRPNGSTSRVLREMPNVSLKTVVPDPQRSGRAGAISVLDVGTGSSRFDPNVESPHHHLVCRSCGKVRDLAADFLGLTVSALGAQGSVVAVPKSSSTGVCDGCWGSQISPATATDNRERYVTAMAALRQQDRGQPQKASPARARPIAAIGTSPRRRTSRATLTRLFRSVAEGEPGTPSALRLPREVGDPVTGVPVGATQDNLKSAIEERPTSTPRCIPASPRRPRDEGFVEIAEWLETLARAEKSPRRGASRRVSNRSTGDGQPAPGRPATGERRAD